MWGEVFKWLMEHMPVVFLILAVIALTWILAASYFHWKHRIEKAENECKKIDGNIMPQLTSISTSFTSLSGSFNNLVIHLQSRDGSLNAALFMSKSPIRLTELGEKILVEIGGKFYIDTHIDNLVSKMNELEIKTALDSQTKAPLVISEVSNESSFNSIKDFIFKNPYFKTKINGTDVSVGLDMSTVSNIMGIYLRDKYLEKHPHLNPEDIPNVVP